MSHPFNRDAELLAAFNLWRNACEVTGPDKAGAAEYDTAVTAERENCRKVVGLPAFTAHGALVKLAALLDLATDTFQGDADHPAHEAITTLRVAGGRTDSPHARATQQALDMVLVLADGYHAKTRGSTVPASPLPALYRRWVDIQARYCSGEGIDSRPEEAELEKALDDAEDRLALEPVRAPIDVIVKVAAFMSEAVRIDEDDLVPLIDANTDTPWQRMISLTEAGVAIFEPDERAPVLALTKAVRGVVGMMEKADQQRVDAERRLAAVKQGASLLSDLECPLGKAEGVAETLFLVAQHCDEGTEPVAYLANRLGEHLADLRRQWAEAVEAVRREAGKC